MLLLLLWTCLPLWCSLPLLLRSGLPLLLWRSLSLLLRCGLALLLRNRLALLLWCSLPLLLWRSLALLLRCELALLLWSNLPLLLRLRLPLLLWGCLTLLLWLLCLTLLLRLLRLTLLLRLLRLALLRCCLPLLLRCCLALLLRCCLTLLLRRRLMLRLLLRYSSIGCLQSRWSPYAAICRERPGCDHASRPAMVDIRKLRPVGAGGALILHLCPHGRSVLLMHRCQFRGTRTHLETARSAVEAHAGAALVIAHGVVVNVMRP